MAKTPKHLRPNRAAIRYELAQARLAMKQQLQPKPAWPIEKGGKTVRDYVKEALSELHADEKVDLQTDEALKFKVIYSKGTCRSKETVRIHSCWSRSPKTSSSTCQTPPFRTS